MTIRLALFVGNGRGDKEPNRLRQDAAGLAVMIKKMSAL